MSDHYTGKFDLRATNDETSKSFVADLKEYGRSAVSAIGTCFRQIQIGILTTPIDFFFRNESYLPKLTMGMLRLVPRC